MQTVLIIDDDPSIHPLVEKQLGYGRAQCLWACDGEAGLALAEIRKPDLVLLDVNMPGLNGHDVCRRLKENPGTREIPVLFLTSASLTEEKVAAFEVGAIDYITKPFDPYELGARASAALRNKHHMNRLASNVMIDELTGLFNRAYFDRQMNAELARARRSARTLCCLLINVDDFDGIVARHGHRIAEAVLGAAARTIEGACREEDTVCRYGDSQFAVLASANVVDAADLAERLSADINLLHRRPPPGIRVTASFGIAASRFSFGGSIVCEAEEALRQARESGGNRVACRGEFVELRLSA